MDVLNPIEKKNQLLTEGRGVRPLRPSPGSVTGKCLPINKDDYCTCLKGSCRYLANYLLV